MIELSECFDFSAVVDDDLTINIWTLPEVASNHEEVRFGMISFNKDLDFFSQSFFLTAFSPSSFVLALAGGSVVL